jgi:hypothetical protein
MKPPITLRYRIGNERHFLEKTITEERAVTLKRTNYSIKVETERRNYLFSNQSSVGKRSFVAYKKIVKDIMQSGIATPDVTSKDVKYWWFKDKEKYPPNFYNVDINSAYPTVLYNVGAITNETYTYLTTKMQVSDLSGWFYMCCLVIGEIMEAVRERFKGNAMYYWVDGIAVQDKPWDVLCFIEYLGYQSKIELINNCKLVNNWLVYMKDGKKKYLHLPKQIDISDDEIRNFLNNRHLV